MHIVKCKTPYKSALYTLALCLCTAITTKLIVHYTPAEYMLAHMLALPLLGFSCALSPVALCALIKAKKVQN